MKRDSARAAAPVNLNFNSFLSLPHYHPPFLYMKAGIGCLLPLISRPEREHLLFPRAINHVELCFPPEIFSRGLFGGYTLFACANV
jgi:hypothetical protein